MFSYSQNINLQLIEPQELMPFKLRCYCAYHIGGLYVSGALYRRNVIAYPDPNEWCDLVLTERINNEYVTEEKMLDFFKCPGSGKGKCNYAMNPNCKPDSPGDMVLLFETKDGWNQHGGPELFTFDNHDPKGGCVLLNDGKVKFIRTEEEFNKLRWK